MPTPTHAVVSIAALDLRPSPDHRAELASQLLLGEVVRLPGTRPRAGWRRVRGEHDGYEGWARDWGLVPVTAARARRWHRAATASIAAPLVVAGARPGGGIAVGPLFFGSRVIPGRRRDGHRAVELPDGRRGWVPEPALRSDGEAPPTVTDRITSLLGAPYLWGGRTPAGIDCSAFVQLVLAEQGVVLPRDARDQYDACRPLRAGEPPRPGDLAFFAAPRLPVGHVGIALGDGWWAHCRGMVRIARMQEGDPLHEPDLAAQFVGWARPRAGRRA